jgi:adenine phosphoribosyltransferase
VLESDFKALIRDIPDFPEPGIVFKDITPLLSEPDAFLAAVSALSDPYVADGITKVVGIEARGFIFAAPIANRLGAGFVPIRKAGKLPYDIRHQEYDLEYGTDRIEVHSDAVRRDDRVLIVDDVLATGGTGAASVQLIEALGAKVAGFTVLVELGFLAGRERLTGTDVHAVVHYGAD